MKPIKQTIGTSDFTPYIGLVPHVSGDVWMENTAFDNGPWREER